MKLDKIKFARVVQYVSEHGFHGGNFEIEQLDGMIDIEIEVQQVYPANAHIDDLMRLMVEGQRKIEAIKTHRAITGMGLKDSKDAVEKYWCSESKFTKDQMLNQVGHYAHNDTEHDLISKFIRSLL